MDSGVNIRVLSESGSSADPGGANDSQRSLQPLMVSAQYRQAVLSKFDKSERINQLVAGAIGIIAVAGVIGLMNWQHPKTPEAGQQVDQIVQQGKGPKPRQDESTLESSDQEIMQGAVASGVGNVASTSRLSQTSFASGIPSGQGYTQVNSEMPKQAVTRAVSNAPFAVNSTYSRSIRPIADANPGTTSMKYRGRRAVVTQQVDVSSSQAELQGVSQITWQRRGDIATRPLATAMPIARFTDEAELLASLQQSELPETKLLPARQQLGLSRADALLQRPSKPPAIQQASALPLAQFNSPKAHVATDTATSTATSTATADTLTSVVESKAQPERLLLQAEVAPENKEPVQAVQSLLKTLGFDQLKVSQRDPNQTERAPVIVVEGYVAKRQDWNQAKQALTRDLGTLIDKVASTTDRKQQLDRWIEAAGLTQQVKTYLAKAGIVAKIDLGSQQQFQWDEIVARFAATFHNEPMIYELSAPSSWLKIKSIRFGNEPAVVTHEGALLTEGARLSNGYQVVSIKKTGIELKDKFGSYVYPFQPAQLNALLSAQ